LSEQSIDDLPKCDTEGFCDGESLVYPVTLVVTLTGVIFSHHFIWPSLGHKQHQMTFLRF
jgi:hypothetical protein